MIVFLAKMERSSRESIAKLLSFILYQGRSFQTALEKVEKTLDNQAEIQAISYGVLRHYYQLTNDLKSLLKKPLKNKDKDIELFILIAFFQLSQSNTPDYAIVNETVKTIKKGKKRWAANLVNGILRNYCRKLEENINNKQTVELPQWIIKRFKTDWQEKFNTIAIQSNIHAPMTIRVNHLKVSTNDYLALLTKAGISAHINKWVDTAIVLDKPTAVDQLPNFEDGYCSVQDAAAQLAAILLAPQAKDKILDACAAPGGKTGHILEQQPQANLIAADVDANRLKRVTQNLNRLNLSATVKQADMLKPDSFEPLFFDRILLDAPCSALGIIRRHPDIKFLRTAEDIENLSTIQNNILSNCWSWLKPGGILLYATCSILKQENEQQIKAFLASNSDAQLLKINLAINTHSTIGLQILPGEHDMDGFYYAKLLKEDLIN